jgi:hypothetical protein
MKDDHECLVLRMRKRISPEFQGEAEAFQGDSNLKSRLRNRLKQLLQPVLVGTLYEAQSPTVPDGTYHKAGIRVAALVQPP